MARDVRSTVLLRRIAETVGVDVDVFRALNSAEALARGGDDTAAHHPGTIQLLRLVRMFRALPTDESRLQALQILEAFGSRMIEGSAERTDRASSDDAV